MGSFTLGVARTIQKYGTATMAAALHFLTKLDYLTLKPLPLPLSS